MISAEEYLSGIGPYRFTETCDIPAAMWTKTWLLRITGESRWADQVERAFLNAGPVPVSRDFKTMSYYQSPNRIDESFPPAPPVPGPGKQIVYSPTGHKTLCCVGSSNWIIPNYVQNMCMCTKDGGLAFTLYGPCKVQTPVLSLKCSTDYPFGEDIDVCISADAPVRMPLYFRIPDWVKGAPAKPEMALCVNGEPAKIKCKDGFIRICRKWKDGDKITLNLPMEPAISEWEDSCYPQTNYFIKPHWGRINNAALDTLAGRKYECITYGPLLYALPLYDIDENTVVPGQCSDYVLNVQDATQIEVVYALNEMPSPWSWRIEDASVVLYVPAVTPGSTGNPDTIAMVPYNCTKFRVSMFRKP